MIFEEDSRIFLLNSEETFTVYRTLTDLLDFPADSPLAVYTYEKMMSDPVVQDYICNLSDWEKDLVKGHDRPTYLPNQLWLLQEWGIKAEDSHRVKAEIEKILLHQDKKTGQFLDYTEIYDRRKKTKSIGWTSYLCDHNLITSVLLLYGYSNNSAVRKALERMDSLLEQTNQGFGWKCIPDPQASFRGSGKKDDMCPMLMVDALRGLYLIHATQWPKHLIDAGNSLFNCWLKRADEKPYMFGHGRNFRTLKPPFFWYNIGSVLDATSHYPELVKTEAIQQLLAVSLLNFEQFGRIIPKSVKRDFKDFSFGQKKESSQWVTLFMLRILKRAWEIDPQIIRNVKDLDAKTFRGSKGGPKT